MKFTSIREKLIALLIRLKARRLCWSESCLMQNQISSEFWPWITMEHWVSFSILAMQSFSCKVEKWFTNLWFTKHMLVVSGFSSLFLCIKINKYKYKWNEILFGLLTARYVHCDASNSIEQTFLIFLGLAVCFYC
jgi:hypothetical protein